MSKKEKAEAPEKMQSGAAKFWLGALLGIIAGTVAGVVMAPKDKTSKS